MCSNLQETADLVTFTEEIPSWKTSFFCAVLGVQVTIQSID